MAQRSDDGLLLVIKVAAQNCHACATYAERGLFDALLDTLDIGDVVQLELNEPSGFSNDEPNYEIFNIENGYPSFKYMTIETYDNLSSMTTKEALSKMCFFNGKIVNDKFVKTRDYSALTVETIQLFCDRSAIQLAEVLNTQKTKPIPKYIRK